MQETEKQIWEVPFFFDSYEEDNDTSEEDSDSDEDEDGDAEAKLLVQNKKKEKVKIRLNHGLEFFIAKEKDFLAKIAKKKKTAKHDRTKIAAELDKQFKQSNIEEDRLSSIVARQTIAEVESGDLHDSCKKWDLTSDLLNAVEYVKVQHDGEIAEREKSYVEDGDDDEPEEDFEWFKSLKMKQPELLETETFFTFINDTRSTMVKGSQAWNCYGNRTNVFLLVNYGFCFKDNLYDSVKC